MNLFNEKIFVNVFSKQSHGLYLSLWVKKDLLGYMHELRSDKVVKKGLLQSKTIATGLRFRMFDKLYCIVNSHFRGTSQKQRNQEYKEIIDSLNFGENLKMYNHE